MADNNGVVRNGVSGRYRNVSQREARAAARAQVTIDQRRGKVTSKWIRDLAEGGKRTA